jgi:hypothetical protein
LRLLLGLGLNFCLQPRTTTGSVALKETSNRFRVDAYTRMLFAGSYNDFQPGQLFLRSKNWNPDANQIPIEFRVRVQQFLRRLRATIPQRVTSSNLTVLQSSMLANMKSSDDFIVFPTDKNLGPAVIERSEYVQEALKHLTDESTYRRLTQPQAQSRLEAIKPLLDDFLVTFKNQIDQCDRTFLRRSSDQVEDPYSHFYVTAKIHKTPWKTRPIVSYCGSLLHGLGRWTDRQLQQVCKRLPTYLKSSYEVKKTLEEISIPLSRIRLFTADAVSMYTNIDTEHALSTIAKFLRSSSPLCADIPVEPTIRALEIIMRNNLFRFGDTYWLQETGTAMGTPPACMYATLYFAICELEFCPRFQASLPFYKRYIDDCLGLWIMDEDDALDALRWKNFKDGFQYGKLTWEFSERAMTVNFLDLTLTIKTDTNKIVSRLYEKPLNLYLYLPPHSAHPPGVLQGLITGNVTRIARLTSSTQDMEVSIRAFYTRLLARGYTRRRLTPIFLKAIKKVTDPVPIPISMNPIGNPYETPGGEEEERFFLHMPYHPSDPSSKVLQRAFRETLLHPPGEPALPTLRNENGFPIRISRLTIAYHRQRNIRNVLFSRRFREVPGAPISSFLTDT